MIDTYEFEEHPLQRIVDDCDEAIASWRKAVFGGSAWTFFNLGMVLIRCLDLWAEMPWQWFPGIITVATLLTHALVLVLMALMWRLAYRRRQRWIVLRNSCLRAMKAHSRAAAEFHLDQLNAALAGMKK